MRLEVIWKCDQEPQHARIANIDLDADYDGENWCDVYVSFGGYFGKHNPNIFAAAPDMYEALEEALRDIDGSAPGETDGLSLTWVSAARTALAKARGNQ